MAERQTSNPTLLKKVQEAIVVLHDTGRPDLGEAVEKLLVLRVDATPREENVPLWISKKVWEQAKAKAASEGRTRSDVIEQGFAEVLAGRFVPVQLARAGAGDGDAKASPAVRLKSSDIEQVTAYAAEHSKEWGWKRGPSPAQIAVVWLHHYVSSDQE